MHKLYTKIPTSYTFTGNARQATFGVSENAPLGGPLLGSPNAEADDGE